ncbi:mitochondrial ribosomal protein MRP51 [Rostrohypoxylon terebratum]|nr:mitochondrial ribosomal protein MRP51 [Rostrohypoxylon terebratum]
MSVSSVSPGAVLLRSSRMFSLPPPIPPPADHSLAFKHNSSTATINFPTHQTVTTTSSSRLTGDWGFKRPFPLKTTTKTTYPLIRVKKVDSIEQITDFDSSSDHTLTLRKFQELSLPLSVPTFSSTQLLKSVFEEDSDVTALDEVQKKELVKKRWKFTGPWLAGMTDGDFRRFLERTVRGRRIEFRAFLRKTLAEELTARQTRDALEAAEEIPAKIVADDISEEQLNEYLRVLRKERMTLYNLVSQFLDLAPVDIDVALRLLGKFMPGSAKDLESSSPYGINGPPPTHPSAGISYLRTRNFLENHPLYGPQKHHTPIKARVLKPVNQGTQNYRPILGVAGFVANTASSEVYNSTNPKGTFKSHQQRNQFLLDLEKRGGTKIYVNPTSATTDPEGRIIITVDEPDHQAEVVQKEFVGELAEGESVLEHLMKARERAKERAMMYANSTNTVGGFSPGQRVQGSARSYGLNY